MSEHSHEQGEFLFVPNEEGGEDVFEVLYEFERNDTGQKYMIVIPATTDEDVESEEEEQEVFAFRYTGDKENLAIEMIEDEAEWDMVQEMFQTWMSDEFQEDVYGESNKK